MPPRSAKKTTPGPGAKRAGRVTRGTPKAQPQAQPEEPVKVEEVEAPVVEVKEQEKPRTASDVNEGVKIDKEVPVVEEDPKEEADVETEVKPRVDRVDTAKKDDFVDEYEKGERLDLEDNDAEYEHEEYGAVDFDEKEIEDEDVQEEVEEIEEEPEEGDLGEGEEGDMVEEEVEDVHEELEGEEDDERAGEEHGEMVDAAEEDEHHEVAKERRKRKEFEIFVGGLDKDASEDDLRKVFSQVGEVTEVRLMMNPQTKKNKGFAFLRFATVEQAKRACSELKNPLVNGKQCGVTPSQDSDTLFLGNICKTWTKDALREKLKHFGVDNIEDLTLVEDTNNKGMNRGFAFLEFSSRSDAMDAFKRLQKRDVLFGVDRPPKVSFADSFIEPGDEIMAQVKTIFVDGLPASWDEDRVQELLKKYGKIEKIELARNMPSAKRKDFGFVTFDTHEAAVICAKSINNEELGEGDNKAKVRARLSRPLQRGRGKHAPHDLRPGRGSVRGIRSPWARSAARALPVRGTRFGPRVPPVVDRSFRRPVGFRDRRPVPVAPPRARPVPPPPRSYDRRPPVAPYPKNSLKRDYDWRDELPSRRAMAEYSRVPPERHTSYRDEYAPRGSGYSDMSRGTSRSGARRGYIDDGYGQRFERPPPAYRDGREREYESLPGSKRPYSTIDDVPPRYGDTAARHSRARLDYDISGNASQYRDAYSDRLGRSNLGYGGSRNAMSSQDSHGLYGSRQGSYGGSDGGMYSSGYGSDYPSRGGDVGGSSYSSLYSGRGLGGGSYMGSGSSGSYY